MPSRDLPQFDHAENGMTRFPPNVEQIRVERDSARVWLIARRNDVELRFPLDPLDAAYLARLLTGEATDRPATPTTQQEAS